MEDLAELELAARACQACSLSASRTQVVFASGSPAARLMVVGEAPGAAEDASGQPFAGRSGQLLDQLLVDVLGLRRHEVYVANVLKCRPPENRDPKPDEVASCRPFLDAQVAAVRPSVVLTLGNFAARALLGTREGITKLRGSSYPFLGATLVPTIHPAAALRGGAAKVAWMREDLALAGSLLGAAA